ncbi:MAG: pyridoxal phosphate-dependent class II aminotransferase [Rhodobacteraceae bacterium]|nr:pyridoxal phosphate-dependent class II aminotransferase [Paracoccaceae bacterium]
MWKDPMGRSSASGRDHGGRLDAAIQKYGGTRETWLDLSTGIAPFPYPISGISPEIWQALPDEAAFERLIAAARAFWDVPDQADILPVPGASLAIAQLPRLAKPGRVRIVQDTYNEHAAAFRAHGWQVVPEGPADVQVDVHPNNPNGRVCDPATLASGLCIVDESFCDTDPTLSHVPHLVNRPDLVVLKSFGKFWGLAGLRLGFIIASPDRIRQLADWVGPWAVSGPALAIGANALSDPAWAAEQRSRLAQNAAALDALVVPKHARLVGGTSLFRLYELDDAARLETHLAQHHILTRCFPYNPRWIRLGIPDATGLKRLEDAL